VVTWEAIEHQGPGFYDMAYLEYLEGIVESAARHGISLFIDPHEDVWSRWTGGDGAPMWTLEAVGFEPRTFACKRCCNAAPRDGRGLPRDAVVFKSFAIRLCNNVRSFFAGNDCAPGILIEGEPVQDFCKLIIARLFHFSRSGLRPIQM